MPSRLTLEDRNRLLTLARETLVARLSGEPLPELDVWHGALNERRGAFVTLTIGGLLRGCIGHVVAVDPLWRSVRENAVAAALHDPRFPPLDRAELDRVSIEVSALSPLEAVDDPDTIEVGRHGLMVERGPARGLLLPQVASDRGWDRATFLEQTCRKAGLEPGCWQQPETRLFVFTVEHFSED